MSRYTLNLNLELLEIPAGLEPLSLQSLDNTNGTDEQCGRGELRTWSCLPKHQCHYYLITSQVPADLGSQLWALHHCAQRPRSLPASMAILWPPVGRGALWGSDRTGPRQGRAQVAVLAQERETLLHGGERSQDVLSPLAEGWTVQDTMLHGSGGRLDSG